MKKFLLASLVIGASASCKNRGYNDADLQIVKANPSIKNAPTELVVKSTVFLNIQRNDLKPLGSAQICSGVIVSNSRILTAAHCLKRVTSGDSVNLYFGLDGVNAFSDYGLVRFGRIDSIRIHHDTDIATIDFEKGLPPGRIAAPPHTTDSNLSENQLAVAAGFGATKPFGADTSSHSYLRWGWLRLRSWVPKAQDSTKNVSVTGALTWNAGPTGSMICSGDSGGPLFAQIGGKWGLVAVHSISTLDCETMGTTADVRPYWSWVMGHGE